MAVSLSEWNFILYNLLILQVNQTYRTYIFTNRLLLTQNVVPWFFRTHFDTHTVISEMICVGVEYVKFVQNDLATYDTPRMFDYTYTET